MADENETQLNENIASGTEPLTGARNQHPQAEGPATGTVTGHPATDDQTKAPSSGLSAFAGDFRIADKITIRVAGAGNGTVQLLLAGDPKPVDVGEAELAGVLVERYFKD